MTMMKTLLAFTLCAGLAPVLATSATAETQHATMDVSETLLKSCTISASQLYFGQFFDDQASGSFPCAKTSCVGLVARLRSRHLAGKRSLTYPYQFG